MESGTKRKAADHVGHVGTLIVHTFCCGSQCDGVLYPPEGVVVSFLSGKPIAMIFCAFCAAVFASRLHVTST